VSFHLNLPPRVGGGDRQRLDALSAYLPQLVAQLNYALGFLEIPSAAAGAEIRTETSDNKVTSISEKSTNTQYPTSRAVYEYAVPQTRAVNGYPLSEDVTLKAADVDAVPTARRINGHALSADVDLTPADLGEEDHIAAQGTDGIWTWRKWDSGIADCWGVAEISAQGGGMAAFGPLFAADGTTAYPTDLFTDVPQLFAGASGSGGTAFMAGMLSPRNHTKTTASYAAITAANTTAAETFKIALFAVGRWKEAGA